MCIRSVHDFVQTDKMAIRTTFFSLESLLLTRIFHESPAATADLAVLPGVRGCSFDRLRTSSPCDVASRHASDPISMGKLVLLFFDEYRLIYYLLLAFFGIVVKLEPE